MERRDVPVQTLFALERLTAAGYEAALVGGCVRDRLMGRTPGDYDIATSALPEETMAVFEGERIVPTGLKHGTVTLVYREMAMEITTFREDGEYSDMRRPDSVRFTRSLQTDVLRRDFTMNALAWEIDRGVVDYTGGERDIRAKRICAVGDPKRRFQEDALRILRAVRFGAQLGFALEEETDAAARNMQENVRHVAPERVRVEMEKTLLGGHAARTLRAYRDVLRPRLGCGQSMSDGQWDEAAGRIERSGAAAQGNAVLLWSALLYSAGEEEAAQSLHALRADNATIQGVRERIRLSRRELCGQYEMRCAVGDCGAGAARDAALLRYAFDAQACAQALCTLERILEEKMPCAMAELAVGGREMGALGLRGREIGDMLRELLDAVRAGRIANEKCALTEYARAAKK